MTFSSLPKQWKNTSPTDTSQQQTIASSQEMQIPSDEN